MFTSSRTTTLKSNYGNKNLKKAVEELAHKLKQRGAHVEIVLLPKGPEKGFDDYLKNHSINEFHELPKRKIADIKKAKKEKDDSAVFSANFPGLIDIALNEKNEVVYIIQKGNSLLIEKEIVIDGTKYIPPEKKMLPANLLLPRVGEVMKWHCKEDNELFNDIYQYFARFSFLTDSQKLILSLYVFLTYLQENDDVHYLLILLFFAVPERGKSKTGKAFVYIAFRGVHIVDLREANLFRYAKDLQATLFLDIRDIWKKAEKNGAEDILLLRYEKGAQVSRVLYPDRGAFKDTVYYPIFGPTLIATNTSLEKILESRCINSKMANRPGNYENPTPEKGLDLKERLTAWRCKNLLRKLPEVEA